MFRIIALIVMVAAILILNQAGAFQWVAQKFVGVLIPKDDTKYAAAMAVHLLDTPKCRPFQAGIIAAGNGAHMGPGRVEINTTYSAATAAGCRKP